MNKIAYTLGLGLVPLLFIIYLGRGVRIAVRNAWVSTRNDIASARRYHYLD